MPYECKILKCRKAYRGGYFDMNIKDELRVYYHFDDAGIKSIWAVKYDYHTSHALHIIFLDKEHSPISNQAELNRMIACCDGHTRGCEADNKLFLVRSVIRVHARNTKRAIMKCILNE